MNATRSDGLSAEEVMKKVSALSNSCKSARVKALGTYSFDEKKYPADIVDFVVELLREQYKNVAKHTRSGQVYIHITA